VFNKDRDSGVPGLSGSGQAHAVAASFLGWTLDAFDFFVVVFLFDRLAADFHVTKKAVEASVLLTLAMRPVGALIFGLMTDRFGRRIPLMVNVVFFSLVELACGFSPNLTFFLVMRALYGIGMGGEWGIGASLAMESVPPRWRGILSGILQSGYSTGYILAAVVALGIAIQRIRNAGPTIYIVVKVASGIEAGKTLIKYKDVQIGQVTVRARTDHFPLPPTRAVVFGGCIDSGRADGQRR